MYTDEEKLAEIQDMCNKWDAILNDRPAFMAQSITEAEGVFFVFDEIRRVVKYGEPYDYELSWRGFLEYKGLFYDACYYPEKIFKSTDSDKFSLLKKYRAEFYEWMDLKIEHRKNPIDSKLTKLLGTTDKTGAAKLATWFARYPSEEVINMYSARVNGRYSNHHRIAIGLARMGDEKVVKWAIKKMRQSVTYATRTLAVECIATSPLEKADIVIQEVISSQNIIDIEHAIGAFAESSNPHKFERLKTILPIIAGRATQLCIYEMTLERLRDENEFEANKLLSEHKKYADS